MFHFIQSIKIQLSGVSNVMEGVHVKVVTRPLHYYVNILTLMDENNKRCIYIYIYASSSVNMEKILMYLLFHSKLSLRTILNQCAVY